MSTFIPTLYLVVVNLYTKFEVSILNDCGNIFDEKSGEKEKNTNTRKNKLENAHLQSRNIQLVLANLYTKFEVSILKSCGDIFDEKSGETEKKKKYREEQTGKGQYRKRPIFNSTIQLVVVNLYTKFEVSILNCCGDIFDEKYAKKEKGREEQIEECPFAISQYNLLLQTSIPNMKFLS